MKLTLAIITAGLAASAGANAALVVGNSLTGPFSSSTNSGTKAAAFTTGASSILVTGVSVALGGGAFGQSNSQITFTINSNNPNGNSFGIPGASLTTANTFSLAQTDPIAVYSFSPVALILSSNTIYWLVGAIDQQFGTWATTNPAVFPSNGLATFNAYKFDFNGMGNYNPGSSVYNAFQINGTASATATPEPASLAFIAGGCTVLFLIRRRA